MVPSWYSHRTAMIPCDVCGPSDCPRFKAFLLDPLSYPCFVSFCLWMFSLQEARERLEQVTRVDPTNARAWHTLGQMDEALGLLASARACYSKGLLSKGMQLCLAQLDL
jgi:hypothetical protein